MCVSLGVHFWRHVERADPAKCWLWRGSVGTGGYGRLSASQYAYMAHRVSYFLYHQTPLGSDEYVCHRCDVRLCVNPHHLFLGTLADNNRDMIAKGRHRPAPRGEAAQNAKLSVAKIHEMRALRRGINPPTIRELAALHGVGVDNLQRALAGRSWPTAKE